MVKPPDFLSGIMSSNLIRVTTFILLPRYSSGTEGSLRSCWLNCLRVRISLWAPYSRLLKWLRGRFAKSLVVNSQHQFESDTYCQLRHIVQQQDNALQKHELACKSLCACHTLGYSQVVRPEALNLVCAGPTPAIPTNGRIVWDKARFILE